MCSSWCLFSDSSGIFKEISPPCRLLTQLSSGWESDRWALRPLSWIPSYIPNSLATKLPFCICFLCKKIQFPFNFAIHHPHFIKNSILAKVSTIFSRPPSTPSSPFFWPPVRCIPFAWGFSWGRKLEGWADDFEEQNIRSMPRSCINLTWFWFEFEPCVSFESNIQQLGVSCMSTITCTSLMWPLT